MSLADLICRGDWQWFLEAGPLSDRISLGSSIVLLFMFNVSVLIISFVRTSFNRYKVYDDYFAGFTSGSGDEGVETLVLNRRDEAFSRLVIDCPNEALSW